MSRVVPENEFEALLAEQKPLPRNWMQRLRPIPKSKFGHSRRNLDIEGANGSKFHIFIRVNENRVDDFTIGLQLVENASDIYTLVRLNGLGHKHTNHWERRRESEPFSFRNQFHIHKATERYQRDGLPIDGYAEITADFDSFESALNMFVKSFGFVIEDDGSSDERQKKLFES